MPYHFCGHCNAALRENEDCHCQGAQEARNNVSPPFEVVIKNFPDVGVYPHVTREEFEELKKKVDKLCEIARQWDEH